MHCPVPARKLLLQRGPLNIGERDLDLALSLFFNHTCGGSAHVAKVSGYGCDALQQDLFQRGFIIGDNAYILTYF